MTMSTFYSSLFDVGAEEPGDGEEKCRREHAQENMEARWREIDSTQGNQSSTGGEPAPTKKRRLIYVSEDTRDYTWPIWSEEPDTTLGPMITKEPTAGSRAGDQEPGTASVSTSSNETTEGTPAGAEEPCRAIVPVSPKEPIDDNSAN